MNPLKKLAGQTAIYGVSSIAGRIFNFLLTPLYTAVFSPKDFGIVSEMYAYVAILLVLVTYGMETSLFNFSRRKEDAQNVFGTTFLSVFSSSTFFVTVCIVFSHQIAALLRYPEHNEYVIWFSAIIGLDAIASIPLAKLRQQDKAKKFAAINLLNIFINIGLNLFFLVYCRNVYQSGMQEQNFLVKHLYNHSVGIGYVFISNLVASGVKTAMLLPTILEQKLRFCKLLWKEMLIYALPLAVGGLGFIINEKLDIVLLKYLLPETINMEKAGIYAANYKLAIFMSIFIQAFRFAMEPFFFNQAGEKDDRKVYADVLHYFVIFCCFVFLGISLNLDILKHFIRNEAYWVGLHVVPILLMANVFLGIYVTMSMWYKLSGETKYGAYFSILGAAITIIINLILIPKIHYYGSAIATLSCYSVISIISYIVGQKHFPVPYKPCKVLLWIFASILLFLLFYFSQVYYPSLILSWALRIIIVVIFAGIVLKTNPEIVTIIKKRKPI